MLQEYIPGTPESVWMFNGYFDRRLGLPDRFHRPQDQAVASLHGRHDPGRV